MSLLKSLVLCFALCLAGIKAWPSQSYRSVPFVIPTFNVTKSGKALAPGYLFLTTTSAPYPAAIIITDEGELIWASALGDYTNLNVQKLNSKPVLTYWNGTGSPNPQEAGHGFGSVHILDSSYTAQHIICPDLDLSADGPTKADCQADLHESYVTERGSLLVTAYNITQADLTSINGPVDGWIYDCLVFEIDLKTQNIIFSWSAFKSGIPLTDSKQPLGTSGTKTNPFDFFHINSIQSVGGKYLVNSRHTWTTYFLDSKGHIEWRFEVGLSKASGRKIMLIRSSGLYRRRLHASTGNSFCRRILKNILCLNSNSRIRLGNTTPVPSRPLLKAFSSTYLTTQTPRHPSLESTNLSVYCSLSILRRKLAPWFSNSTIPNRPFTRRAKAPSIFSPMETP